MIHDYVSMPMTTYDLLLFAPANAHAHAHRLLGLGPQTQN
jgi:hypothetical protein